MKYDRLEQARKELHALQREHHGAVHRASVAVKASRAKLDAAQKKVRDIEMAIVNYDVYMERERKAGRVT